MRISRGLLYGAFNGIVAALILAIPVFGQNQGQIVPSGRFTVGHAIRCQNAGCTVAVDAGGAAGSAQNGQGYMTELGITNTGTPFCINDALTNSPSGYHQICLGANALGGGLLSYNAYAGASALGLNINVNGTTLPFPGPGNGNVIGPTSPNPTATDVVTWNGGTVVNDFGILKLNPTNNDGQGGGLNGNSVFTFTPVMGTISSITHSVGEVTIPDPSSFALMNNPNVFWSMHNGKWGTGVTATNPVPAGTKGWLEGYNNNIATAQNSTDVGDSFDADTNYAGTVVSTGSIFIRNFDGTLTCTACTGNSDNVGVSYTSTGSSSGSKNGFIFSKFLSSSGSESVVGFNATSGGSGDNRTTGTAFVASGSKWSESFADQGASGLGEQSTFKNWITVGDTSGVNPLGAFGNTGAGEMVMGAINNVTVGVRQNNVDRLQLGASGVSVVNGVFGIPQATWVDNQACTAGAISVDANFIYVCTATNTVKRASLSSF